MSGEVVKQKLREMGVNLSRLAEAMGITPQGLNSMLSRKSVKVEQVNRINKGIEQLGYKPLEIDGISSDGIPILDIRVCAGNGIYLEECENAIEYVNMPQLRGCYGVTVYGDSMRGMFSGGDLVFVKPIENLDLIEYGRPYVVKTDEEIFVKIIYPSRKENHLRLVAFNQETLPNGDRMFPDIEMHIRDIKRLYRVKGHYETI